MAAIERPPSPPSYLDPPPAFTTITTSTNDDGELPNYSRNAAADERIMLLEPLASARASSSMQPVDYIFTSERLELNMGRKRFPIKVPCYGMDGVVEGKVTVKDFKAAAKLSVTLEGACNTNVVERGMNVYSSTKKLLSMTEVLWTRSDGSACPDTPQDFSFSFRIPTNVHPPLPHSYATVHPGLNADVTYYVKVDLFRKGLRRHERQTMVLYLPRSTPPETPQRTSGSYTEPPALVQWETIPILPRCTQAKAEQSSQDLSNDAINLILPLPKVYASAAPIPFQLAFPGSSPLLPYVTNSLIVQLIKSTFIHAGGFISLREGIIATGEISRIEDESYPTPPPSPGSDDKSSTRDSVLARRVYNGTLKSFREGGETSWSVPDHLEIRHAIRVFLRAPKSEGNLPEYFIDHPVQMCTHNHIPNATDIHDPVIGLIAISGSQGTPTSRAMVSGGVWI
ncbi:SubName: Full=Uncharacterized protein {ECO:0000313/EMBL:CCA72175.1} [Serendipita indica DSM 11827]|nr:SubName: Full=Uncharacterized protein {ECO:0000313/EMBL:CCA72175.1} [Serendipita indica DSM 11827]